TPTSCTTLPLAASTSETLSLVWFAVSRYFSSGVRTTSTGERSGSAASLACAVGARDTRGWSTASSRSNAPVTPAAAYTNREGFRDKGRQVGTSHSSAERTTAGGDGLLSLSPNGEGLS